MMQKCAELSDQIKGIPNRIQLLQPGRDYIGTTALAMKETFVKVIDNEKVVGEFPKEKFEEMKEQENSLLQKYPNHTTECFEKEINVELFLFSDLLLFVERSKTLFFSEVLTYHSSINVRDDEMSIVENQIRIVVGEEAVELNFSVANNHDEWMVLLNGVFDKQHQLTASMKDRRKTVLI